MSTIQVGMGATLVLYTDRRPFTIVEVSSSGRIVTVQEDKVIGPVNDGYANLFQANPQAIKKRFSRRKNGKFLEVGQTEGPFLKLGERDYYYDPHF